MAQYGSSSYQIGWICALPNEFAAAKAMLDERHGEILGLDPNDHNSYEAGQIHQHNVVIASLPAGKDGIAPAAIIAQDMRRSFPDLRAGLLVGIGGGIPSKIKDKEPDIRLGDVVVSKPDKQHGGVVHYDKGKITTDGFIRKSFLNQPPQNLLTALQRLQSEHFMHDSQMPAYLSDLTNKYPKMRDVGFIYPGVDQDHFFASEETELLRTPRDNTNPHVHYGIIASGNQVIADSKVRDKLQTDIGALCVEMEAAGLMNNFPCLAIRGICDYADSYKSDTWQNYAAATAAAFAKELLYYVSPRETREERPISEVLGHLREELRETKILVQAAEERDKRQDQQHQDEKALHCHRTFKTSDYESQKDINPARAEGTCGWALQHPRFLEWRNKESDDLLWISADPGCGKSVLSKSLVDLDLSGSRAQAVSYFFFKDNEIQESLATALCALIHQLFHRQPWLVENALSSWKRNGDSLQRDINELWRILMDAGTAADAEPIICVLDALDECKEIERGHLIKKLAKFHRDRDARSKRKGWLKFLVTSRPYDDIKDEFGKIVNSLSQIRLMGEDCNGQIRHEIDVVIRAQMEDLSNHLRLAAPTKDRLTKTLLEMENRTYLWLYLVIAEIRDALKNSLEPNTEPIVTISPSTEKAYEKILKRGASKNRRLVKKILRIIIGARRPLSILDMARALGVADTTKSSVLDLTVDVSWLQLRLRDWCGLFIFVNHDKVYLIHQTAKEFLIATGPALDDMTWRHCLTQQQVNRGMADISVRYLTRVDPEQQRGKTRRRQPKHKITDKVLMESGSSWNYYREMDEDLITSDSFWTYCAENWGEHVHSTEGDNESFPAEMVLPLYNTTGALFNLWFGVFWQAKFHHSSTSKSPPDMTDIALAACTGHSTILRALINASSADAKTKYEGKVTPLCLASQFGHERVVQILLNEGADLMALSQVDGIVGSPVEFAASQGHHEIVRLLLDKAMVVNGKLGEESTRALLLAAESGQDKVIEVLLEKGVDIEATDPDGRAADGGDSVADGTAVQQAAVCGHAETIRMLMEHGAQIDKRLLFLASRHGSIDSVRTILEYGEKFNANSSESVKRAFRIAAKRGHADVVELLLKNGASLHLESTSKREGTAMQEAVRRGHISTVKILLEHGADVNAQNDLYGPAIQEAAANSNLDLLQLLLEYGADVDAYNDSNMAAIHTAAAKGSLDMVKLLLEYGAVVNVEAKSINLAMQEAAARGNRSHVEFLSKHNGEINPGRKEIQEAATDGNLRLVELLLKNGSKVRCRWNALQEAAASRDLNLVKFVLEHGTVVRYDLEALQEAVTRGNLDLVKFLLEHGAEVKYDFEALQRVVPRSNLDLVKLLLERGAVVKPSGSKLRLAILNRDLDLVKLFLEHGAVVKPFGKALGEAAASGDLDLIKLLLERGADPKYDREAIQEAVALGNLDLVKLLLEHGADANADYTLKRTTLIQEAAFHGNLDLIKLLIKHGAVVKHDRQVIQGAVARGDLNLVEILLEHGADANAELHPHKMTLVQVAAKANNFNLVKLLLKHGADVSAVGYFNEKTSIREAAANGNLDLVKLLLENGADVNYRLDDCLQTVMQEAAANNDLILAELLLQHGADVDAKADFSDRTAMREAATNGNIDLVKLLLEHSADVNAEDADGRTAIQEAAANGFLDLVNLLLEHGADVKAKDLSRRTASDLAAERGN